MTLLQISEPGQLNKPHQTKLVIGIDLGTTNSLVAAKRNGIVAVLPDAQGDFLLPSVLAINAKGDKKIGHEALTSDASYDKISSIKRILGYDFNELAGKNISLTKKIEATNTIPAVRTAYGLINPIEISADILLALKNRAESTFADKVSGAVITVPAYFDEPRRKATKHAAQLAGLLVLRLINEPTAAALAYGLDKKAQGKVLVYDLGGGTFDVSILDLSDNVFEVKATFGDILLGGDDFDARIVEWIKSQIKSDAKQNTDQNVDPNIEQLNALDLADISESELYAIAKAVKEKFSNQTSVTFAVKGHELVLTEAMFNELIADLVAKTLEYVRMALVDAALNKDDIAHIVLVGGSTRVKLVQQRLSEFFAREILNQVDPDQVVAIGAAIAAENLSGNQANENLLIDVTPLSLGIETAGDLVEKIIPRNTAIPISKTQEFTTFKDGQTAMKIHVVQGERDNVHECRSLAKFSLKNIPPMTAGVARISVNFSVDADGLLTVCATEMTSGTNAMIDVTPSYGLEEADILQMLTDSINSAQEDMAYRKVQEQLIESQSVLDAINKALAEDSKLLNDIEEISINKAIKHLQDAMAKKDADIIRLAIKTLENAADSFIEKRMNNAISKVMQGHTITEFEAN